MKFANILGKAVAAIALAAVALGACAQGNSTIRVLVGFPPGAGADLTGRIYAELLGDALHTSTIVENKPGAGGLLANHELKTAQADSNSVMVTIDHQVVMLPLILKNPGFDVRKDMVPVGRLLQFHTCLAVSGDSTAHTLAQFVEQAKANPDRGNFGVPAPGSQAQFVGFVTGKHFNAPLRAVPYRGAAPALTDLIGGHVPAVVVPCDALTEYRKAGKVRVLAVAADRRLPIMDDVPTFSELGVIMPTDDFVAVYASPSMKPEMLKKIVDATRQMFDSPKAVEKLNSTRMVASYASPDELRRIQEKSAAFWAEQVRVSNFQAQ